MKAVMGAFAMALIACVALGMLIGRVLAAIAARQSRPPESIRQGRRYIGD